MSIASINTASQLQQSPEIQQKLSGGRGGRRASFSLTETTTASLATQQTQTPVSRASALKPRYTAKGKSDSQADGQSDQQQAEIQNNRAARSNGSYVDIMA